MRIVNYDRLEFYNTGQCHYDRKLRLSNIYSTGHSAAVLKMPHFRHNLRTGAISKSVWPNKPFQSIEMQHTSLLDLFIR
jgi:hypothetical protein